MLKIIIRAIPLFILVFIPSVSLAIEEDSLKDMDLESLTEKTSVEEKTKFFSISGYLESRNQLRIKDMDDPISLRQRLWLDCYLGQDLSAYGSPAQAGWIRGFASARADARLPILLANGTFLLGPVTLEGVLIPKAEVNEFLLPDSPWEPEGLREMRRSAESGEIVLSLGEEPDDWFKDSEFAFRVSTVTGGFDLAFLYYNGYTYDPAYHRNYLTDGRMRFTPRYYRYQAYGFNFAKGLERITIRGELAVKSGLLFSIDSNDTSYAKDSDGLVARDLYQGVIGIDRTFFTNLYLNLQFFYDFIESGREAIALKRKTHGLTFEISNKFLDDDLNAGFRGMYYTNNEGSACEIFAEYKIGDNWTIAPGCMFFNGPKDSRLGQYRENDMVYLRLRYSF